MRSLAALPKHWTDTALGRLKTAWAFTRYTVLRFAGEGCLAGAGALSYTTLVALVPLTAIAVAVLSAFPAFAAMRDQILANVFSSVVPELGGEVEWWFRYFAGTSVRTTTIGAVALIITVVLLLATIEDQLHNIWRVKAPRPWVQRILAYWAILTLGPLLLGLAFSLPSYVDIVARSVGVDTGGLVRDTGADRLLRLLPFALETLAFTLIYALIPNCSVRWREAFAGAVVAALLLEALKVGFVLYVSYFSSYRAVYGALAAIPIFLLWMYIAWSAVLFGAVVAAALPQWQLDRQARDVTFAAYRLGLGLALIGELAAQLRQGGTLSTSALAERLGSATVAVDDILTLLRNAGLVAAAANGGWVLARALDSVNLIDLYRALQLPLASSLREASDHPWQARVAAAIQRIAAAERDAFGLKLSELVTPAPGPRPIQLEPRLPRTS